MIVDVAVTVRIRLQAKDENKAQNHVLDLFDSHLGQISLHHRVIETSVPLSPTNPTSTEVKEEENKGVTVNVDRRGFDHIVAALRVYQTMLEMNSAVCQDVENIAEEHGEIMTPAEIDDLVEEINSGSKRI